MNNNTESVENKVEDKLNERRKTTSFLVLMNLKLT